MSSKNAKKVAFISSFPPRKCGIATFVSDLIANTTLAAKEKIEPLVVAMRSDTDISYKNPVKFEIRRDVKTDYFRAADFINFSHVDLVSVQHEFGLFGGDAGNYLSLLLKRLKAPIVTTLHTILDDPQSNYYKSMVDVCQSSQKVITMNSRGLSMLKDIYQIPKNKTSLIAHGIPDLPFVDSNYYKYQFTMEGRKTILTFGLLSRNKGIEVMLDALPEIIKIDPTVLYIILGMTHPEVQKQEGESYRFSLQRKVKDLGLQNHVVFYNRFVSDQELANFLCAADIYVTPYLNQEQLTSGTLSFAVGAGKAVVSTPYWAATELLSKGRGRLVRFGDSKHIASAIIDLINDDSLFYSLRKKAYDYGRERTWKKIGEEYWHLFKNINIQTYNISCPVHLDTPAHTESTQVPDPSLAHFSRITDDTGLFQHAKYVIPRRDHGYCTDDNSRALVAMTKYYAQYGDPEALKLFNIFLSFVLHSQNSDGSISNFMDYNRCWVENEPKSDAMGRVLWALGTVIATPPFPTYISVAKDAFDRSISLVAKESTNSQAYAILGMCDYLKQFPGASDIKRNMELAADRLLNLWHNNTQDDWNWFSNKLTYDNALLPCALLKAGLTLDEKYIDPGLQTCDFIIENTFKNGHFSFIGCNGWYKYRAKRASFDQQPIEAAATILMLKTAYEITKKTEYNELARKAFDWFLGDNDLGIAVYNFKTKGCHDGLMAGGVNLNQGAESLACFTIGLLNILETYTCDTTSNKQPNRTLVDIKVQNPQRIPINIHSLERNLKLRSLEKKPLNPQI